MAGRTLRLGQACRRHGGRAERRFMDVLEEEVESVLMSI